MYSHLQKSVKNRIQIRPDCFVTLPVGSSCTSLEKIFVREFGTGVTLQHSCQLDANKDIYFSTLAFMIHNAVNHNHNHNPPLSNAVGEGGGLNSSLALVCPPLVRAVQDKCHIM